MITNGGFRWGAIFPTGEAIRLADKYALMQGTYKPRMCDRGHGGWRCCGLGVNAHAESAASAYDLWKRATVERLSQ